MKTLRLLTIWMALQALTALTGPAQTGDTHDDTTAVASQPVLSEILASNRGGRRDEDGDSPDWMEIYNSGTDALELGGWHLTDSPRLLTRWQFPHSTRLPAGGRIVVFASGKDRAVAGAPLHTNFQLAAEGESVLLVAPDEQTVASQILNYPAQRENASYGIAWQFKPAPLLTQGSAARVHVPKSPEPDWMQPGYDDSAWLTATLGVGFDRSEMTSGDGLLGWWNFDEAGTPSRARDASGQGRDGVVSRSVFSADGLGRSGRAGDRSMVFQGSGVVSFPAAATGGFDAMAVRDTFTISVWTLGAATLPQDNAIFYGTSGTGGGGERVLDAHLPWSDSTIYFDTAGCCDTGTTRIQINEPDTTQWRGQWNHYVFLKNGDTKQIWQNGRLLHEAVNTANQTILRSLFLGAMNSAGALGYRGRVDDFAIWETALEPAQIAALAAGARPPDVRRLTPLLGTDIGDALHTIQTTAYVRVPLTIEPGEPPNLLMMRMKYDDGFVAWLNGVEVARRHTPEVLTHTSAATVQRDRGAAMTAKEFDLSRFASLLRPGVNVLALQGLNHGVNDGTFLLGPELRAGRMEEGRFFTTPTPGEANGLGVSGFVEPVTVSPERGFYEGPVTATLSCATPGATIVYTTDGSVPTRLHGSSGLSPLQTEIRRTTLLRTSAFKDSLAPADITTNTYLFVDQVAAQQRPPGAPAVWPDGSPGDFAMDPRVPGPAPAPGYSLRESLLALPSLSLISDPAALWGPAGIYTQPTARGKTWERLTSVEWLDPSSPKGFGAAAGLRIHGNISRNKNFTPKHGFSLRFRSEYGHPSLNFPLFPGSPVEEFDELVVRAGSTDTWPCTEWAPSGLGPNGEPYQRWNRDWASYVRDQWARDSHLAMGHEDFRGRYCHLYLNGLYWGLYNVTETPSASHMAAHLGGPEQEWDTVADFSELRDGSRATWDQLLQMANHGQLSNDAGLRRVQGLRPDGTRDPALPRLLNVDNLIDYIILHISIGADDWPNHNWWGARRSRGPDPEGFQFFVWDQEISNVNTAHARSAWGPIYAEANADGTPTRVYARLRSSPEFRMRFADRVQHHLFDNGALTQHRSLERWRARVAEIDRALVAESARWGDAQVNHTRPGQPYTRENAWLPHLDWMASNYWSRQPATALTRLKAAGLFPAVSAPRFSPDGGTTLSNPNPAAGTLFYTTSGEDPRQWGGTINPAARSATADVTLAVPGRTLVRARVRQGTVWSALAEKWFPPGPDLDEDGIDDTWETIHGFSTSDPADATLDSDGDGQNTLEEFLAHTDPRRASSRLHLRASTPSPGDGAIMLHFELPAGRRAVLERASRLEGPPSWSTLASFGPQPEATVINHPTPIASPQEFYRLRLSLAP